MLRTVAAARCLAGLARAVRPRAAGGAALPSPAVAAAPHRRWYALETALVQRIEREIAKAELVVFMKGEPLRPQCGFSRGVIDILDIHGIDPTTVEYFNVLADPELKEGIKEYSSWPSFPQVYMNRELVGGFDILSGLHNSGEIVTLLQDELDHESTFNPDDHRD